nr:hypothetical protein [Tanacetum cinerariifolium]
SREDDGESWVRWRVAGRVERSGCRFWRERWSVQLLFVQMLGRGR